MRFSVLSAFTFIAAVVAQSSVVEQYIASESPIAKAGLLANIGGTGSKASGADSGVIIASPSKSSPDYFYTWTRDAALVAKWIIEQVTTGADTSLRSTVDAWVASQKLQQQVSNPSGSVSSGGLGEPKFYVNLAPYTGGWGRPQRDGPALRATSLITYANWLIKNSNTSYVTNTLWPIIKLDLDYVASSWNQTGFDLWEEVNSSSFFTTAVQLRSLREGAALATVIGQTSVVSNYNTQATNALCFLQSYWNPTGGYVTSNTGGGRSGKDANSALASVHNFDIAAGCDATTFQPCSDKALSSLKVYIDSFRSIYTVNNGIAATDAVATGRYPEDSYYGGNPWYLTTAVVAEQLYDALTTWKKLGSLQVTSTSLTFFKQFSSSVTTGTYASSTSTYTTLTNAIKTFADGFIAVNAKYTPSNGALSEQFTRAAGVPTSASDLTWSYAATLTAFAARTGYTQESWGAAGLTVPATCSTGGSGGDGGSGGNTVAVTFSVYATTVYGENIYLTGSLDALKNWSPDSALLLSSASYPTWKLTVNLPASTSFSYKYIRKNGGSVNWESDPNRSFTTPASGTYTLNDSWR